MPRYFVHKTTWYNQVYLKAGEVLDLPKVPDHMLNKLEELPDAEPKKVKKEKEPTTKEKKQIHPLQQELDSLLSLSEPGPEDVQRMNEIKSELKRLQAKPPKKG